MNIKKYYINCGMGISSDWKNAGFSEDIINNLNEIGYTGKLNGKKISLYEYLNSLSTEKVNYSLNRINGNGSEFVDNYLLIIVESNNQDIIECECGGYFNLIDHLPLDMNLRRFDGEIFGEAKCSKCGDIKSVMGEIKWKIYG